MTFHEKLKLLVADYNRTALTRRAGLPTNAISDYINMGGHPRADTALKIARVLNVCFEWLVDDEAPWPPVQHYRQAGRNASPTPKRAAKVA